MRLIDLAQPLRSRPLAAGTLAAMVVVVNFLLSVQMERTLQSFPFLLPLTGVTLVAFLAGRGSAIATAVLSGLVALVSMLRFGVRTFWAGGNAVPPRLHRSEVVPVLFLLALSVFMTVQAGPILGYLGRANDGIHRPQDYIERVLHAAPVAGAADVANGGEGA